MEYWLFSGNDRSSDRPVRIARRREWAQAVSTDSRLKTEPGRLGKPARNSRPPMVEGMRPRSWQQRQSRAASWLTKSGTRAVAPLDKTLSRTSPERQPACRERERRSERLCCLCGSQETDVCRPETRSARIVGRLCHGPDSPCFQSHPALACRQFPNPAPPDPLGVVARESPPPRSMCVAPYSSAPACGSVSRPAPLV